MTDSLFVSLCKRGCPYFHTGSLVHRWQVVFGSALLHRVHFWLMARLTSQRRLWHFPPLLFLYYDSAAGDADWFTFRISHYMYKYSAFGDVDWYSYYVTACMYSASGDDDWSLPFPFTKYIPRYAILIFLHVVIPLSYPCKIILFIVSAIICTLLWWLMCYFLMIILNTAPRILGSSQNIY